MKVELKLHGLDGVLETLQALPAEVVSKRGGPVKLALAKGARLLRDEAKKNIARAIAIDGSDSTGTTQESIIATRGKPIFGSKGERYLVRIKRKQFINRHGSKTNTRLTARTLEYGNSQQAATPWLRPSVQRRGAQVIDVVTEDLLKRLDRVVAKLAAQNTRR